MRENEIDIMEIIINHMPEETQIQERIKLYMKAHKSNCNNYIYSNYSKETTFLNTILKSLTCDLSAEIAKTIRN